MTRPQMRNPIHANRNSAFVVGGGPEYVEESRRRKRLLYVALLHQQGAVRMSRALTV